MKHNHHPTDNLSRFGLISFFSLFRIEESVLTSVLLTCDLFKYYIDQNCEIFTSVLRNKLSIFSRIINRGRDQINKGLRKSYERWSGKEDKMRYDIFEDWLQS